MKKGREYIQRWTIHFSTGIKINFSRRIHHSSSNLPELAINEGTTIFKCFTENFSRKIDNTINPTCCCTNQDLETHCQSTLDRSTTAKENTFIESVIYNGENLIHKNQGHNAFIKIIDSGLNTNGVLKYTIEFQLEQEKSYHESILVDRRIHMWHHCLPPCPNSRTPLSNSVIKTWHLSSIQDRWIQQSKNL